jgi:hypothetical protein
MIFESESYNVTKVTMTLYFVISFYFLSMKTDVNVTSKRNMQKISEKKTV